MSASQADLARRYGIEVPYPEDESYPPGELFPDKSAWVVREEEGQRILDVMSWGVPTHVPGKRIDKATGKPVMLSKSVTNVRNLSSPFWRSMLDRPAQRCLVPVTTFSEYAQTRGSDGKLPLHWFDVPSRSIFSFAGIWRLSTAGTVRGSKPLRLLAVHLKSGCNTGRDAADADCPVLFNQEPVLKAWIDKRVGAGEAFAILGDWNRRLASTGDQFFAALDRTQPKAADLTLTNDGRQATCNPRYREFIDYIVVGSDAAKRVVPGSFAEYTYGVPVEQHPSDHCPVSIGFGL